MPPLYNFNPGQKSWKMYANTLTSIAGDDLTISPVEGQDLILEVSGNDSDIMFKHGDNNILTIHSTTVNISPYTRVDNYLNVTGGARIEGQATLVAGFNSNNDGLIVKSYEGTTGMDLSSGELIIHSTNNHNLIVDTTIDMSKNGIIDISSVAFSNTANITTPDVGTLTISGDLDVLGDISNSGTVSLYDGAITIGTTPDMLLVKSGTHTVFSIDILNGRVGIGIADPEENLEVDGSIQIDSNGPARLKFKKSGQNPHALGEIDAEEDGTDGGRLKFYTKTDGVSGNGTEKLRINNVGAIGIGGANYGDEYNILQSNGSGNPPEWTNTLNVESIYAGNTTSNTISSFTRVLFKMIQSIFKFYDITENILASISSVADGVGGKLRFYTTNATSGLEVKQLTIKESGALGLGNAEDCGIAGQVLSSNGAGSAVSWISVGISQPKIMFHGVFNNKQQNCTSNPPMCYANGFSDRFSPIGGGWNAGGGSFTAPRDCYMNFCWQCLLFSNNGNGSNVMNAAIEHVKIAGGTEVIVNQYIPSYNDGQNQLQASPVVTAVIYMRAGDYVRVKAASDQHFRIYSIGINTHVSFSGHNCD